MPSPILLAKTKADCLAEANSIFVRITTKVKTAVACKNKFILRENFYMYNQRQQLNHN